MPTALNTLTIDTSNKPERRGQIRMALNCSALIRINSSMTFPAQLRDLSLGSAQVVCDARYALMIDPSGTGKMLNESKPVELAVALPANGHADDFKTRCRVKYCSPTKDDTDRNTMVLGLKFLSNDFAMLQKLDHIIEYLTNA